MKKKFKSIDIFPDPYAPFNLSQGISIDNLLFISGQISINEFGNLLHSGDFTAQTEQAFTNLRTVLKARNSSFDHVLKVTIFLTDLTNFQTIVDLREKYFSSPFPADTIVEVSGLFHPKALIEIEAIAIKN
ncbi:hypothetical protein A5819_003083 [Enterococcus sp. 7E2_DIV0204]|uniref:RidA family protein n=1 Tax=unclassified Enterococcus TaxID=2608891 RepID=UPI000A34B322|nr:MULTISPECIES: RidA family protein [unclassified Enterococcus]OTN90583.1 hypothetical protein A5819_003083 [Enterococcus sp. 7E2_DIV0204]OTP53039.1 hypothetical protein A5884_002242 [Enterococcus sp. 7D2_DIV0200]